MKIILKRLYLTKRITDRLFVYCETLIEQEPWPFPYFSENGFSEDMKTTIEDELFLELDQAEISDGTLEQKNTSEIQNNSAIKEELHQEFDEANEESEDLSTTDSEDFIEDPSRVIEKNEADINETKDSPKEEPQESEIIHNIDDNNKGNETIENPDDF